MKNPDGYGRFRSLRYFAGSSVAAAVLTSGFLLLGSLGESEFGGPIFPRVEACQITPMPTYTPASSLTPTFTATCTNTETPTPTLGVCHTETATPIPEPTETPTPDMTPEPTETSGG